MDGVESNVCVTYSSQTCLRLDIETNGESDIIEAEAVVEEDRESGLEQYHRRFEYQNHK